MFDPCKFCRKKVDVKKMIILSCRNAAWAQEIKTQTKNM
jgi:hypothetical protein